MSVVMASPGAAPSGPTIEGTLFKWTNYWHGWQPRWFLLDQGVLTYYKSREEVCQGCKGSVKISACEIVSHPIDTKRLDIIIPSEQHYYLKAASETERQQWLVLLGSVKQASGPALASPQPAPLTGLNGSPPPNTQTSPHLLANESAIKIKKSELRLCCDMLMQQAHAIKTSDDLVAKIEAAETLNKTCDTFIRFLDALMQLTESSEQPCDEDVATPAPANTARELRPPLLEFSNGHGTVMGMVGSLDKQQRKAIPTGQPVASSGTLVHRSTQSRLVENNSEQKRALQESQFLDETNISASGEVIDANGNSEPMDDTSNGNAPTLDKVEQNCGQEPATFFSAMNHSFRDFHMEGGQIPIEEFLACCRSLLPVFDILGSTAFAPVKMDIQGNIDKLDRHKKETGCSTLQELVQRELDTNSVWAKASATDALLWLKRAMSFICSFLRETCCQPGEVDLAQCAARAYAETLKKHHNFVVKGVFSVAVRALPYYSTFLKAMAPTPEAACHPEYERTLKQHGIEYTKQLQEIVRIIDVFYVRNDIVAPVDL